MSTLRIVDQDAFVEYTQVDMPPVSGLSTACMEIKWADLDDPDTSNFTAFNCGSTSHSVVCKKDDFFPQDLCTFTSLLDIARCN